MSELVFEVFSEEIPSRMQEVARSDLKKTFILQCEKSKLSYKKIESFVTPRRLSLCVEGVGYSHGLSAEEKKGPRVGSNQKAIEGFAHSCNLNVSNLEIRDIGGVEYYFASLKLDANSLKKEVVQILDKTLTTFSWPKSMRWGSSGASWVRPIRNILCIFSGQVLPISFAGLSSNDKSYGHRFLSPVWFEVSGIDSYKNKLSENKVILSSEERRSIIEKSIQAITDKLNLTLVQDDALLTEIVGLIEYPVVICGNIEKRFLSLPREILVNSIRVHQKYLSLQDSSGNLAPYFISVINNNPKDVSLIIKGNETVLRARLYDAEFFFEEDKKKSLASRVPQLKDVIFHKKLGSVLDKTERVVKISQNISDILTLSSKDVIARGALLSKADLLTNVVSEFPELQGVAGKYYAMHDKENNVVAEIISDHYLPRGRYDACPPLIESSVVSIADNLDSIVGLFSVGEAPTSSKDPYGLRRNALGVIRTLIESKIDVSFAVLLDSAIDAYNIENSNQRVELFDFIEKFFVERFRFFIKDLNLGHTQTTMLSFVSAVLDEDINFYSIYAKVVKLAKYFKTQSGIDLYFAIKRVNNILSLDNVKLLEVKESLFKTEFEREIFALMSKFEGEALDQFDIANFEKSLAKFEHFSVPINQFFDSVKILDDDKNLYENRVALLSRVLDLLNRYIKFSAIEL